MIFSQFYLYNPIIPDYYFLNQELQEVTYLHSNTYAFSYVIDLEVRQLYNRIGSSTIITCFIEQLKNF